MRRMALRRYIGRMSPLNTSSYMALGMAVQLLSDLGLHLELDQARFLDRDTPDTTNLRRTVFWATQGLDM